MMADNVDLVPVIGLQTAGLSFEISDQLAVEVASMQLDRQ